jgi:isopenicillin-N epimerase
MKDKFILDPQIIFLNHGSFGATPKPVFDIYQAWQSELEHQPVEFLDRRFKERMAVSRTALAEYFGTGRDNLVYVTNATVGVNTVARSLNLRPGEAYPPPPCRLPCRDTRRRESRLPDPPPRPAQWGCHR